MLLSIYWQQDKISLGKRIWKYRLQTYDDYEISILNGHMVIFFFHYSSYFRLTYLLWYIWFIERFALHSR